MAAYTTIDNPELYFQTKLYTGNGSTQSITLDGDEDMQPDFLWFKVRSTTGTHAVFDSVRGTTGSVYRRLAAEENTAEDTAANTLTTIGTDGFSVGSDGNINGSSETFVAWCWKESATAGFDIISYTGDGSDRDLSHSLSASPEFILIKQRSGTQDWSTQSTALGLANYLILNGDNASAGTSGALVDAVSSSTISVDDNAYVNGNTSTYIGYLFAGKQGFSKFGSYTGNGNADGTFVYTGFRPAYIMIKNASATGNWEIFDTKRSTYNLPAATLYADTNAAEYTGTGNQVDILSNGFKCREADTNTNGSGNTHIFMAFAEAPFVNSEGVPCNAR